MNSSQDRILQSILHSKSNIKQNLIKYYDTTKSDIDIAAQQILCNDLYISNNHENDNDDEQSPLESNTIKINDPIKKREKILDINKKLINLVEVMFENNMKEIDRYFVNIEKEHTMTNTANNIEDIKLKSLTSYCIFISRDKLKDEFKRLVTLGILITTDWFLDDNQIYFLR